MCMYRKLDTFGDCLALSNFLMALVKNQDKIWCHNRTENIISWLCHVAHVFCCSSSLSLPLENNNELKIMNWSFYEKVSTNILIAKSTVMNCTIKIDEELNYIELLKNMLDLAGSQWSQTESEALKWHVCISFCFLCVPHCPWKYNSESL